MDGIKMDEETGERGAGSLVEREVEKTKNSLSTDRLDMSFGEIMSMYEREEIIIDPEFQRLFRWSNEQQTRFIES
jgi:2-hydroxy-3-keto-5-methylthiopentenyl-1-phosphate phosphatase